MSKSGFSWHHCIACGERFSARSGGTAAAADEGGIATAPGKAQAVLSGERSSRAEPRILLVEDDRDLAAFMHEVLAAEGST